MQEPGEAGDLTDHRHAKAAQNGGVALRPAMFHHDRRQMLQVGRNDSITEASRHQHLPLAVAVPRLARPQAP